MEAGTRAVICDVLAMVVPNLAVPHRLLTTTLVLSPSVSSAFPELIFIPLFHPVGRSLHLRNVAILQQKGGQTHTLTLDSVQLFTQLNPDVFHNLLIHPDYL